MDAQKAETMDAAQKLFSEPTMITAELGGLKLDKPLESATIRRRARPSANVSELPVTDAGPGFAAEPLSVTTTSLHTFPDAEKAAPSPRAFSFGQPTAGTVVRAKLFAPKGRSLRSVTAARVLQAIDDKGRPLTIPATDAESMDSPEFRNSGSRSTSSQEIQLQLPLPRPDAQSIEEPSAEAIALTAGHWKEMTVSNLTATSTNEIDLSAVLPGAKMVLSQFNAKGQQVSAQIRITGPPACRQIDVESKVKATDRSRMNVYEQNVNTRGEKTTRTLQLQQYGMVVGDDAGDDEPASFNLLVRFPEDLRRERVHFVLRGLDLF